MQQHASISPIDPVAIAAHPVAIAATRDEGAGVLPRLAGALVAAFFALCIAFGAEAGTRVALVLGNADYRVPSMRLDNPVNDARAVADKLRALDFEVMLHTDADRPGMTRAIESFSTVAKGADMAVVFFAGHGIQKDGENYLLGTRFDELTGDALDRASVTLSEVQAALKAAKPGIGIVILDACRNNPFAEQGIIVPGLARSSGGAGLLVAYSTDPGNIAYDGDGQNSQFTAALLRHLDAPGLDVRLMFGRVRQNVILDTHGGQIPWVEDSVIGEHSFSRIAPLPPTTVVAREIERWREISTQPGREPYQAFLSEFPDGMFRDFARQRIEQAGLPQAAEVALAEVLDDQTRPAVAAALSVLGYLPMQSAGRPAEDGSIRSALGAYAAQTGAGSVVDPARLYMDASRMLGLLGAKTAQQLRNDMALLSAVESAASMAEDALAELGELARGNNDARALLVQAQSDVETIHARRKALLEQVDAGRAYYTDLLQMARAEFQPTIRSMASTMSTNTRSTEGARDHGADIGLFVKHIDLQGRSETEGSYAWMIDFIPD